MNMKNSLIMMSFLVLSSCVTNRPQTGTGVVSPLPEEPGQKDVIPVIESPSMLKRKIVDIDFRKAVDKSPRKRVVVLPFLDRDADNRPAEIVDRARMGFMNELNKTQEMVALDASELKMDLTPYLKNGEYDLTALAQATQNLGISSVFEGKVIDVRFKHQMEDNNSDTRPAAFEVVVKARMLNVKSGQELVNIVKTVSLEEESTRIPQNISSEAFFAKNSLLVELLLKDAFMDFTGKMIDSLGQVSWEGRIAALQGEKIYLNVGQVSGLQIGDILKVVEDGTEVYDPEIGYHVGKVPGKVKGTLEVIGYFGQDGAVGVLHSGAGFKENDRIEIYE